MSGVIPRGKVTAWLLALAFGVGACSNGAKNTGNGTGRTPKIDARTTNPAAPACERLRDHITSLYKKAEPAKVEAKKQKRRASVLADNVNMVLVDCNKDPKRFTPCIKSAVSVAQLERDCLIKLDDEGRVEGDRFLRNP